MFAVILMLFRFGFLHFLLLTSLLFYCCFFFFFKQKTAYELRFSDWSSDVCSSDLSRMHEPSFSHSRPRFGWRWGTFSPSRRQIRSTRLWFTDQPAVCSSAVTRR